MIPRKTVSSNSRVHKRPLNEEEKKRPTILQNVPGRFREPPTPRHGDMFSEQFPIIHVRNFPFIFFRTVFSFSILSQNRIMNALGIAVPGSAM